MEIVSGSVVKSKAGHDKNRFYAVVHAEGAQAWIADGKRRKLAAPKKKNEKHLALTALVLSQEQMLTDKTLRRALSALNQPGKNG